MKTSLIRIFVAFAGLAVFGQGAFATVTFTGPPVNEVMVPTRALVLIGDESFVFVETAPWQFKRRVVQPGEQQGDSTVIGSGLRQGERVVVEDAVFLQ